MIKVLRESLPHITAIKQPVLQRLEIGSSVPVGFFVECRSSHDDITQGVSWLLVRYGSHTFNYVSYQLYFSFISYILNATTVNNANNAVLCDVIINIFDIYTLQNENLYQ